MIPPVDQQQPEKTETASFAMGCFWGPDGLFGSMEGVVRTRVGYAGGSTENPTYQNMGDHIETVQLDFDPQRLSYSDLLQVFLSHHNPGREPWKRQYSSAAFFHNQEQEKMLSQAVKEKEKQLNQKIHTILAPFEAFYLAEFRHQKYKLQRHQTLMADFKRMYPDKTDFIHSTAAALVNGYLTGYGKAEVIRNNPGTLGLSSAGMERLLETVSNNK